MPERQSDVDRPEPDEALTEHRPSTEREPSDLEDRPVELDDPAETTPPTDEQDRDPGRAQPGDADGPARET